MSIIKPWAVILLCAAAGIGLLYLAGSLSSLTGSSLLAGALVEELLKLAPFLIIGSLLRTLPPGSLWWPYGPLMAAASFGLGENIRYFLNFPESSIYLRLLYAYLIHLNTGLIYALGLLGKNLLKIIPLFAAAVLYHWSLNWIALGTENRAAIWALGLVNLVIFIRLSLILLTETAKNNKLFKGVF